MHLKSNCEDLVCNTMQSFAVSVKRVENHSHPLITKTEPSSVQFGVDFQTDLDGASPRRPI